MPLALAVVSTAWAPAVEASCVYMGPLCQTWRGYDAIFDGTVRSIERLDREEQWGSGRRAIGHRLVTFDIHEWWRGSGTPQTRLFLWGGYGMAISTGFDVEVGERYLIFANRTPDGQLTTSSCSPSREYTASSPDLAFLRSLRNPGPGARIFGETVLHSRGTRDGSSTREKVDATVRITGPHGDRTLTPNDGRFEITRLEPGTYVVTLSAPSHVTADPQSRIAVLPDAHACFEANFYLQHRTSITGRVLDAEGKPLHRKRVELADAATWQQDPLSPVSTYTERDGSFSFTGLAPGAYIVGINLRDTPNRMEPSARATYPGRGVEPQPVYLEPSGGVDLGVLQLGPDLAEIPMALRLTWEGGLPIANRSVRIEDVTGGQTAERQRPIAHSRTDRSGSLRISGRATRSYVATVWIHERGTSREVGRSEPFTAEAAARGLTLVLASSR
jgi:hypothetical protein